MEQTPKEQLHELMVEMFEMIEGMDVGEGKYLEFADLFKKMNLNINRLAEMKQAITRNVYYERYVRRGTKTTIKRKRLTEAQKAVRSEYILCSCGCYINKDEQLNHIQQTLKHRTGVRNKKYSAKYKNPIDPLIDFEINREVLLQGFCIKHYSKINQVSIDDDNSGV